MDGTMQQVYPDLMQGVLLRGKTLKFVTNLCFLIVIEVVQEHIDQPSYDITPDTTWEKHERNTRKTREKHVESVLSSTVIW